jgi:hypothetical protein
MNFSINNKQRLQHTLAENLLETQMPAKHLVTNNTKVPMQTPNESKSIDTNLNLLKPKHQQLYKLHLQTPAEIQISNNYTIHIIQTNHLLYTDSSRYKRQQQLLI